MFHVAMCLPLPQNELDHLTDVRGKMTLELSMMSTLVFFSMASKNQLLVMGYSFPTAQDSEILLSNRILKILAYIFLKNTAFRTKLTGVLSVTSHTNYRTQICIVLYSNT
jgi:hypothetical protein